jgi:peptidoglycan/xylan/chitin deacetylase (PgdA/CDA1 family)
VTGVILMYHRVAAPSNDAYGLAVSPSHFAAHVDYLRRLGCVVPLTEITKPARTLQIAVTFDDGYVDNAVTAAPLLASADLPTTYFITTGWLGGQLFWWDRLASALLENHPRPQGVDVTVGDRALWLDLSSVEARRTSLSFLHGRLQPLPPCELEATLNKILTVLKVPEPSDAKLKTMTTAALRAMSDLPHVAIGAHTRTHLQLAGQSESLQREEVMGSIHDLQTLLGHPVDSFAYPFGGRSEVGNLAPRLAQEAGCILACGTQHGAVERRSDSLRMPRLNVMDWEEKEFRARIFELAQPRWPRSIRRRDGSRGAVPA